MNSTNQQNLGSASSGHASPKVEQIRGGTRVLITQIIVAGSLIALIIAAICILLFADPELAKAYGSDILKALIYALFVLFGILAGSRITRRDE